MNSREGNVYPKIKSLSEKKANEKCSQSILKSGFYYKIVWNY